MIEYLYDAIKAVAGQEICISAVILDEEENPIEENCYLTLHDDDSIIVMGVGEYFGDGLWQFNLTASSTSGLNGRYWYCIQHDNSNLCFKQPIYLV